MNQKKQIIILVALCIVVVGVLVFQFTRGSGTPSAGAGKGDAAAKTAQSGAGKGAAAAKTAPPKTAAPQPSGESGQVDESVQIKKADVNIDDLLSGIKEVDFDYDQNRLPRDPMAPLVGTLTRKKEGAETAEAAAPATPVQVMNKIVSGIVWDARRPLAVVDNEVVYPGYVYADGVVVESIDRDHVTFKVGDSLIQNPLKEF